jgi:hypothetical protein
VGVQQRTWTGCRAARASSTVDEAISAPRERKGDDAASNECRLLASSTWISVAIIDSRHHPSRAASGPAACRRCTGPPFRRCAHQPLGRWKSHRTSLRRPARPERAERVEGIRACRLQRTRRSAFQTMRTSAFRTPGEALPS